MALQATGQLYRLPQGEARLASVEGQTSAKAGEGHQSRGSPTPEPGDGPCKIQ